ncbi:hypothetical protein MIND_01268000 [Mycena indigotica]|uniref:Uncharacterized protein n=1 Tax=Mycena indigotica TaxID=2126181 RepID=A0A8H6VV47_9AGAR|nr:uncharacterized protein MIND_01268000 [Mycena indigotica]KAF7291243.1 hypothetical protein MIND_01268000 [Mycena indigotica]
MPPLSRVLSAPSVHSWWSDSNPTGASLNLHAAAKPLLRFMYANEVFKLMEAHPSWATALTDNILNIYLSYLGSPYVSRSTKCAILQHFTGRMISLPHCAHDSKLLVQWANSFQGHAVFEALLSHPQTQYQVLRPSGQMYNYIVLDEKFQLG